MLIYLLQLLFTPADKVEQEARDAYLASATDLIDLEYRMREWDRRDNNQRLFG